MFMMPLLSHMDLCSTLPLASVGPALVRHRQHESDSWNSATAGRHWRPGAAGPCHPAAPFRRVCQLRQRRTGGRRTPVQGAASAAMQRRVYSEVPAVPGIRPSLQLHSINNWTLRMIRTITGLHVNDRQACVRPCCSHAGVASQAQPAAAAAQQHRRQPAVAPGRPGG